MKLDTDDFELFGIERRFAQDRSRIDRRWRELAAEVHPDRFAAQGAASQRAAMQWAVRVNEAYQRLKNPVSRAAYLCSLNGAPVDAENNTAMPSAFLMQQMEWRESLEEATDLAVVERLAKEVAANRQELLSLLERLIDVDHDFLSAAATTRALMFIERFESDIDRRLDALGQ